MKNITKILLVISCLFAFSVVLAATVNTTPKPTDFHKTVTTINDKGNSIVKDYAAKNGMQAMDGFSGLYFDHYEGEGMELAVTAISPSINTKTEALFTQLIGLSSSNANKVQIQKAWQKLQVRLNDDLAMLQSNSASTFGEAFAQSFIILVREGFEAMLIITALLTYLRRANAGDKAKVIYYGVGFALAASAVTAYLFATAFKAAGANREAMEGITMLVAAAVLFYVSYWLFSKREASRWQGYIKSKMDSALTRGSLFALGLAAFLAVYREGAETILFYQALAIGSHGQSIALISGFITACIALFFIYWAMKSASFKIPFKFFFSVTAIFLFYMAFFFIGGGILELQEAGWIAITPVTWIPQLPWLGIFSTAESAGAQAIFLGLSLFGWLVYSGLDKRRMRTAEFNEISTSR